MEKIKTQRIIYNNLVGEKICFKDGTHALIVKRLPNKDMYNELFKRFPTYKNINNIKELNEIINVNIVILLKKSEILNKEQPDFDNKHIKQKIKSFDTRIVKFVYNFIVYDLTISIANITNDEKIVYAKKYLKINTRLTNKIKEMPRSESSLTFLYKNNIP